MLASIVFITLGTIYMELYIAFYLAATVYGKSSSSMNALNYAFIVLDNTFYIVAYILTIWKW